MSLVIIDKMIFLVYAGKLVINLWMNWI